MKIKTKESLVLINLVRVHHHHRRLLEFLGLIKSLRKLKILRCNKILLEGINLDKDSLIQIKSQTHLEMIYLNLEHQMIPLETIILGNQFDNKIHLLQREKTLMYQDRVVKALMNPQLKDSAQSLWKKLLYPLRTSWISPLRHLN